MWNSVWLRTRLLASFVVLFVLLFVVTIALYGVSEKYHGLNAEDMARQYGWRYGPTAFLTVILSLWAQIDYSSKILTPWQEMRRAPTEAEKSVLVDYISPPMLIVFWRAMKRHHWAVMASILGILLIQLATVFSTGLFVLEPTTLSLSNVPMTVGSSFNGSDFRLTNTSTSLSTGPSILYYGSRVYGLASQPGVDISRGLVMPDFAPSDRSATINGTNYTAIVPGVEASLDCEYLPGLNGTKTYLPWWSINGAFFVLNITTPSCNIRNIIVGQGPDHNIYHQENATQAYMGYFGDYLCDPSIDYSAPIFPDPSNTTVEHRIVMTMADLRFPPRNWLSAGAPYIYVEKLTVAVCKSGYAMGDYEVTYKDGIDGHSKSWMADKVSESSSEIPGFSSAQLGAAVHSSLDETYLGTGGQDWVLTKQVPTFYQILSAMNGNVSIGLFMDHEKLISSATDAFKGIAAELINKHMMKPSETTVSGSMLYYQNRLWVRALSVGFMAAAFILLAGLTIVLLIFRPMNVVPSDPGSIGATALILAESSTLRNLLLGLGAARTREIKQKLSSYNFRSVVTPGPQKTFTVVPTEHGQPTSSKTIEDDSPPQSEHWWTPVAAKLWFQLLSITLPIIIIAVLEVVQRLSDDNNGFVDLGTAGFATTHGFATYIPAVVAFIVATMFTSIQLAICTLSPWLALHRGSAPASRSLFLNLINRLAPHRIFLAFKHGNVGEVLIMVATFLAAWLPILVSGLYVTVPATASHSVSLAQSDVFDFKLNNLFYEDNLAGTIAGLIAFEDLAYPEWTYGDLAFNKLDATGVPTDISADTEVPFAAKLRATRPSLTCDVISPDSMAYKWDDKADAQQITLDRAALNITYVVPWMCESPRGNITNVSWFQGFALPKDGSPIYFGHASVLTWSDILHGNRAAITDTNRGMAVSYADEAVANWVGGYGCPSFAVTLGRGSAIEQISRKNKTTYDFDIEVTSIVCSQRIEVVDTNVTLRLPSLGVISTPPVPDESTAEFLINELSNYTGPIFEFPLNNLLLTLTHGTGNVSAPPPSGGTTSDANQLDDFVQFLATANASLPIDALVGHENSHNLIDATNRLYKTYMPQAIDRNMRTTDLDAKVAAPDAIAAKVEPLRMTTRPAFPGRLRLKQEAAPKFALQAVLAVMVLCAIVSRIFLRDIEKLVPHNPCSIAGRAALFADGEVSTRKLVPYGAEWRTEAELSRVGVYEGWLFSLGWWESMGVYKYGVDIGWIDQGKNTGHDIK
ncbi:hypothetical protein F5B22DRAFT_636688 [Xylaria bambusicola]|uniref:uncharacterized protein n=1 Tax=Xylaria bambusicola TaxID=326684 RepID=UPI002008CFE5|nr:uncharacterized protein F5B22DRAFT_636688 [Xylaria bambusicola]KAI0515136.1 hypothetical protein F5B22DRAFT_636688 [Xylaria bambusicola]